MGNWSNFTATINNFQCPIRKKTYFVEKKKYFYNGRGFDGWCRKLSLVWDPMYGEDIDLAPRVWPLASFLQQRGLGEDGSLWSRERRTSYSPPTHLEHGWVTSSILWLWVRISRTAKQMSYIMTSWLTTFYDPIKYYFPPSVAEALSRWWGLPEFLPPEPEPGLGGLATAVLQCAVPARWLQSWGNNEGGN